MNNEFNDAEEHYLRETLAMLQESYAKAAKPYIDRLVAIQSLRPLPPIYVTAEQAEALFPDAYKKMVGATGIEPVTSTV